MLYDLFMKLLVIIKLGLYLLWFCLDFISFIPVILDIRFVNLLKFVKGFFMYVGVSLTINLYNKQLYF